MDLLFMKTEVCPRPSLNTVARSRPPLALQSGILGRSDGVGQGPGLQIHYVEATKKEVNELLGVLRRVPLTPETSKPLVHISGLLQIFSMKLLTLR